MFHWRETRGAEVDLVVERPSESLLVEVKSGATATVEALRHLAGALEELGGGRARLVYGGEESGTRLGVDLRAWDGLDDAAWLP